MSAQVGPVITIAARCTGCTYLAQESYACQGDSGFSVWCEHPASPRTGSATRASVGDTTWSTPKWCPLLSLAIDAHIVSIGKKDA